MQILFSCSSHCKSIVILFSLLQIIFSLLQILFSCSSIFLFSCSPVFSTADTVHLFSLLKILFSCSPYCRFCFPVLLFSLQIPFSCSVLMFSQPQILFSTLQILFSCSPILLFSLLQILSKFDRKETLSLYSANKVFILSLVLSKNNKCRDKKRKLFRTCDNFILYYLYLYHSTQPYGRKDGYSYIYNISSRIKLFAHIYMYVCISYRKPNG